VRYIFLLVSVVGGTPRILLQVLARRLLIVDCMGVCFTVAHLCVLVALSIITPAPPHPPNIQLPIGFRLRAATSPHCTCMSGLPVASSSPSESAALSLAQSLYADAILSVLHFLRLPELAATLRLCRSWYNASGRTRTMNEGGLEMRVQERPPLLQMLASRVRLSIADLRVHVNLNLQEVLLVRECMPQLKSVAMKIDGEQLIPFLASAEERAVFVQRGLLGPRVQSCNLQVRRSSEKASESTAINSLLLDAVCTNPSLTSLRMTCASSNGFVDFTPLLRLPNLQVFRWYQSDSTRPLHATQMSVLKQLASLRVLDCGFKWSVEQMTRFVQPPHSLAHLEEITAPGLDDGFEAIHDPDLEVNMVVAMSKLPGLTTLGTRTFEQKTWPLLVLFPSLTFLAIGNEWHAPHPEAFSQLLITLPTCSKIRQLSLSHLSNVLWTRFAVVLPRLPQLVDCDLDQVDIRSIHFLSTLSTPLEELRIRQPDTVLDADATMDDLANWGGSLLVLELLDACMLSEEQMNALKPYSALLPRLNELNYIGSLPLDSADENEEEPDADANRGQFFSAHEFLVRRALFHQSRKALPRQQRSFNRLRWPPDDEEEEKEEGGAEGEEEEDQDEGQAEF
jgi:hypothetical protein